MMKKKEPRVVPAHWALDARLPIFTTGKLSANVFF